MLASYYPRYRSVVVLLVRDVLLALEELWPDILVGGSEKDELPD